MNQRESVFLVRIWRAVGVDLTVYGVDPLTYSPDLRDNRC